MWLKVTETNEWQAVIESLAWSFPPFHLIIIFSTLTCAILWRKSAALSSGPNVLAIRTCNNASSLDLSLTWMDDGFWRKADISNFEPNEIARYVLLTVRLLR